MKINLIWALVAIMVTVVVTVIAIPGLISSIGAMVTNTTSYCNDTPYDAKCICPANSQKIWAGVTFDCVATPLPAEEYTFPLKTWGDAYAFAEDQIGTISCSGDLFYEAVLSGNLPIDAQENTGLPIVDSTGKILGYALNIECLKILTVDSAGRPQSGTTAWRIQFDPNDAFIYLLQCNPTYIANCPPSISFRYKA